MSEQTADNLRDDIDETIGKWLASNGGGMLLRWHTMAVEHDVMAYFDCEDGE